MASGFLWKDLGSLTLWLYLVCTMHDTVLTSSLNILCTTVSLSTIFKNRLELLVVVNISVPFRVRQVILLSAVVVLNCINSGVLVMAVYSNYNKPIQTSILPVVIILTDFFDSVCKVSPSRLSVRSVVFTRCSRFWSPCCSLPRWTTTVGYLVVFSLTWTEKKTTAGRSLMKPRL